MKASSESGLCPTRIVRPATVLMLRSGAIGVRSGPVPRRERYRDCRRGRPEGQSIDEPGPPRRVVGRARVPGICPAVAGYLGTSDFGAGAEPGAGAGVGV